MIPETEQSENLTLAAALLVPAATIGFVGVFTDSAALIPIMVAAALSSALAALLRRLRIPLPIAAVISVMILALLIISRYAPNTAAYLVVPTRETLETLRLLADEAAGQFRSERAPVEAVPGFVGAAMIGAWILAFLTDWAAIRLRLAFEPVLPAALLFIFVAILGTGDLAMINTIVFAAAVAFWGVTQRTQSLSEALWLRIDAYRGPASVTRGASVLLAIALVVGVVIGPRMPGIDAPELYHWRARANPARVVVSPYVSIESRLTELPDVEMFTVVTERPAYWRLAGLDAYNDGTWSTRGNFEQRSGSLPGSRLSSGTTIVVTQAFRIHALSEIWLPAAYAPSRLLTSDATVTWNSELSSLTVDSQRDTSDGISYQIESVVPLFTPEELRAAPPVTNPEVRERYLALPDNLTPLVASLADEVAGTAPTAFDQLIALQDYFHAFDYSLNLSPRRGDPIEQFISERVGFCQQFAGTFALMARSLGLPARVAVGFTWGDPVAGEPNTYRVSGRHTHAWPEIYFEGLGWVAFEPTPGRGAPDGAYTGVTAQQDSGGVAGAEPTETEDLQSPASPAIPEFDDFFVDDFDTGDLALDDSQGQGGGRDIPWRVLAVVALLAAYGLGMPWWWQYRRNRRRQRATTPAESIEATWANLVEDLDAYLGVRRPPAMSRTEWADHIIRERRLPGVEMRRLAESVTLARFSPGPPPSAVPTPVGDPAGIGAQAVALAPPVVLDPAGIADPVAQAEADAAVVRDLVNERVPRWRRWLVTLNPRRRSGIAGTGATPRWVGRPKRR